MRETGSLQAVASTTQWILSDGISGVQHHFPQIGLCLPGSSQLLLRTLWKFFLYEWNSNVRPISSCVFNNSKATTFEGEPYNEESSLGNQVWSQAVRKSSYVTLSDPAHSGIVMSSADSPVRPMREFQRHPREKRM